MKITKGQAAAGGGFVALLAGVAAYFLLTAKKDVTVTVDGCAGITSRTFYINAWKDPVEDPSGAVHFSAGINGDTCRGTLKLAKGFYRIAVTDNMGRIYYSEDKDIQASISITVDGNKYLAVMPPGGVVPKPYPVSPF